MNQAPLLFLGLFFALACSWYSLVFKTQLDIGRQEPVRIPETGQIYPLARAGDASEGASVYRANGCVYCHTQQVRGQGVGSDLDRGWGKRLTVAQDFLHEQPPMLGSLRVGPDLVNMGARQPRLEWHLLHLYNPRITSPGSSMPPYRYLFRTQRIGIRPSSNALKLTGEFAPPAGMEVVATQEGEALAAYLVSLQSDASLFEAPLPMADTNSVPGSASTNAPSGAATNLNTASSTNSPK